jgi:hypothetical protein
MMLYEYMSEYLHCCLADLMCGVLVLVLASSTSTSRHDSLTLLESDNFTYFKVLYLIFS